jgi:hypothetical protein
MDDRQSRQLGRPARQGARDSTSAQVEQLRLRRTMLLERLASVKGLAAERELRIADLRLALMMIPKIRPGSSAASPLTDARIPAESEHAPGESAPPQTEPVRSPEDARGTYWTREQAGDPNSRGRVWAISKDSSQPRWWQATLRWPGRRIERD